MSHGANIHPDVQNPWLFTAVCIGCFFTGLAVGMAWSELRHMLRGQGGGNQ